MPRFLALIGRQKVLFPSILRMLLELVLTTSTHPFGSSFSKLEGYGGKLGTRPSVVLCSVGLCEGAKLEVEAGTVLICRRYNGITGSNAVAFTGSGAGDMRADLSTAKNTVNAEITKDLLYFVCDDEGGDKIP